MPKGAAVPGVVKKAGPTKRARRSKAGKDRRYAKTIRETVAERDGYCKLAAYAGVLGRCEGPSEWAHWGAWKRCKTRGLPPEDRHTTGGSLMLCRRHHRAYDAGQFNIVAVTEYGMDRAIAYQRKNIRPEAE